jgi:FimV-like protein
MPTPVPAQPTAAAQQQPEKPVKPAPTNADKSEKLQLAIVYMNMGDEVMARMLLEEIARDGSDAEKAEAKAMMARMNNPSDQPIIADKNDKID